MSTHTLPALTGSTHVPSPDGCHGAARARWQRRAVVVTLWLLASAVNAGAAGAEVTLDNFSRAMRSTQTCVSATPTRTRTVTPTRRATPTPTRARAITATR